VTRYVVMLGGKRLLCGWDADGAPVWANTVYGPLCARAAATRAAESGDLRDRGINICSIDQPEGGESHAAGRGKDPSAEAAAPRVAMNCDVKPGALPSDEGAPGALDQRALLVQQAGDALICSALITVAERPESAGDPGVRAALLLARFRLGAAQ
jgi:hypothetical protein